MNNLPNIQLTESQNKMLNNFNELIQQSSQAFLCPPGSACDINKNTTSLYKKYIDSERNLSQAPMNVDIAEKNYYLYTLGNSGYDTYQTEKFTKDVDGILKTKIDEFVKKMTGVKKTNENIKYIVINTENVEELNNNYDTENKELTQQIVNSGSDILTNDRKSFYEKQNYDILLKWYSLWFYIYYGLLMVFCVLVVVGKSNYSLMVKIGMILFFLLYNFLFYYAILYGISSVKYVNNLLPKNTNF